MILIQHIAYPELALPKNSAFRFLVLVVFASRSNRKHNQQTICWYTKKTRNMNKETIFEEEKK